MEFYSFSASCASKYVSAFRLVNESEASFSDCDLCGNKGLILWESFEPVFECETVTSRRTLPDVMLYGGRIIHSFNNWVIVSEAFKTFCENNNVSGVKFSPVSLIYTKRGKMNSFPDKYFLMQIYGRAQLDSQKMGIECTICPKCSHYVYPGEFFPLYNRNGFYPTVIDISTWDGSDIFNHCDCTGAFVDKLLQSGLRGIDIQPYEEKFAASENTHYMSI